MESLGQEPQGAAKLLWVAQGGLVGSEEMGPRGAGGGVDKMEGGKKSSVLHRRWENPPSKAKQNPLARTPLVSFIPTRRNLLPHRSHDKNSPGRSLALWSQPQSAEGMGWDALEWGNAPVMPGTDRATPGSQHPGLALDGMVPQVKRVFGASLHWCIF